MFMEEEEKKTEPYQPVREHLLCQASRVLIEVKTVLGTENHPGSNSVSSVNYSLFCLNFLISKMLCGSDEFQ